MKLDEDHNNSGRPRVFTEEVLVKIPIWVVDGWSVSKIAEYIGTSQASVLATCSRLGISLKVTKRPKGQRDGDELVLRLPKQLSEKLDQHALDLSISTEHLVVVLLSQIANDNLFDAVLDFDDVEDAEDSDESET